MMNKWYAFSQYQWWLSFYLVLSSKGFHMPRNSHHADALFSEVSERGRLVIWKLSRLTYVPCDVSENNCFNRILLVCFWILIWFRWNLADITMFQLALNQLIDEMGPLFWVTSWSGPPLQSCPVHYNRLFSQRTLEVATNATGATNNINRRGSIPFSCDSVRDLELRILVWHT